MAPGMGGDVNVAGAEVVALDDEVIEDFGQLGAGGDHLSQPGSHPPQVGERLGVTFEQGVVESVGLGLGSVVAPPLGGADEAEQPGDDQADESEDAEERKERDILHIKRRIPTLLFGHHPHLDLHGVVGCQANRDGIDTELADGEVELDLLAADALEPLVGQPLDDIPGG